MEKYYIASNKYSLQERKLKDGKKVYDVAFRVHNIDGTTKQKRLCGYESKTMAKQGYLAFVDKYCEIVRHAPKKAKDPEKEVLFVGDLVRQYLASLGNINKQSVIYDKENIFRIYILPSFTKYPLHKLTKEELYKWQDNLWNMRNAKNGQFFSHRYLAKIRSTFNAFLVWCEQRYGEKNNLKEVVQPKRREPKKAISFWTREQFEKFISCVDNETYHALFTFMFFTGRRKGEIFALYKTDVLQDKITFDKSVNRRTFGKETWEITTTKEDKANTLPVCKVVQEEIKRYTPPKEGKFYFGGKEPLPPTTVERYFKKYTAQAGLPPIRLHGLRHSFASMLISHGASLFCIAELLSDTVEMVTLTYGHLYEEDKLNVLAQIK